MKSPIRWVLAFAVPIGGVVVLHQGDATVQGKARPAVTERRLIFCGPSEPGLAVDLTMADVVQLQPFHYANSRDFQNARLKVTLSGDRVLEEIGQLNVPGEDGSTSRSVFLLAREPGQTQVDITLINREQRPMEGYKTTYRIGARPR